MNVRATADTSRFLDIDYKNMLTDPVSVGKQVLDFSGIALSAEIEAGMSGWIEANKREHRAAHKYTLDDFNLKQSSIQTHYQSYIDAFISA